MSGRSAAPRIAAVAGLSLLLVLLAWRIVTRLTLTPDEHLQRAEAAWAAGRLDAAESEARAALDAAPLDGRAYRVLALVAVKRGNAARVAALLPLALRYAPRDVAARALAAQAAIEAGDYAAAVGHCDRLLRVDPERSDAIFPILAWLEGTDAGREALVARLADRPPWRSALLQYLAHQAPRADALQLLFHALNRRDSLTPSEMTLYISRFTAEGLWNEAYLAWLNELPAERRQLLTSPVDGGFELVSNTGAPFDWQIVAGQGVEAGIVGRSDSNGHALRVAFTGGRGAWEGAHQLLLLQPGLKYRFRWSSRYEALDTPIGLRWALHCANSAAGPLMATLPGRGTSPWRLQELAFSVPAGCPAQWLQLELAARIPAESYALGAASFDDIAILDDTDAR